MYVIIRRKNSKRYIAAIPVKKGVSATKLRSSLSKRIKSGLTYRLVTDAQLKKLVLAQRPKTVRKKPVKRRVVRRKK